jgi:hypothetical protein
MKHLKKIWGIGLLALLLIFIPSSKSRAQDISSQDFYDNLAPYGTWVSDPQYGDVWVPDAEDDFRPYGTQGHWVLTEYGNTWVSDYPWGWATFHYGRWHYDDYYGWEWIPGYEWAPAWVSWREGGGYYGWAPLMPGISLSMAFGGGYNIPNRYWVCAPQAYINSPNIRNYYIPHTRVVTIIHNTTIINNTYVNGNRRYIAGPRAADIERITHQRPQVYRISNANTPGAINVHNNEVNIYRPSVRKAPDARPQRVVDGAVYRQQNPNQGIAHTGNNGGAGFNHSNAAKLATVARSSAADNKVVRVNERPNNVQPNNNAAQPGNRPNIQQPVTTPGQPPVTNPDNRQHNRQNQQNNPPVTNPVTNPASGQQPVTNPDNRQNRGGRPESRPNVAPVNPVNPPNTQENIRPDNSAQQQQAQQAQRQQQQVQQQAQQAQRQQQQAQQQAQQAQRQQQQVQQQAQQAQRQQQQAQQQQAQRQQQAQQAQQRQQQQRQQQPRPTPPPPRPAVPPQEKPPGQ